jgi:hypothetical protein
VIKALAILLLHLFQSLLNLHLLFNLKIVDKISLLITKYLNIGRGCNLAFLFAESIERTRQKRTEQSLVSEKQK